MKLTDDSIAVGRGFSRIKTRDGYTFGIVATSNGIVDVCSYANRTRLDFVNKKRLHMRMIDRHLTPLGLARAAHRFSKHIANKSGEGS